MPDLSETLKNCYACIENNWSSRFLAEAWRMPKALEGWAVGDLELTEAADVLADFYAMPGVPKFWFHICLLGMLPSHMIRSSVQKIDMFAACNSEYVKFSDITLLATDLSDSQKRLVIECYELQGKPGYASYFREERWLH